MRAALQPGQQAGATAQQHRTVSTTAAATPPAAGAAPAKPPLQQPQQVPLERCGKNSTCQHLPVY